MCVYNAAMKINTEKIKREIKRQGISQMGFAESIGMTRQGLWEVLTRETTTFKTLNLIAEALGVDGKDLLL